MFGIETLGGNAQAAALIAVVLAEAAVLYAGYGLLERVLGPTVTAALRGA
ncbi:DUF7512 family protein [Haloarchaeobius sp. DFWS5]